MAKRRLSSRRAPFLTLGTIAATGVVLAGCGDDAPTDVVFSTPQECAQSGADLQVCEAEYQQALQKHLQDAPRFTSRAACEEEFGEGQCLTAAPAQGADGGSGSGFFLPFMTGYLVSSAISNIGNYAAYQRYRSGGGYANTPVYRTRSGETVTGAIDNGRRVSRPVNVNTRTVSRSGFGGRSFGRSGGGFFGG